MPIHNDNAPPPPSPDKAPAFQLSAFPNFSFLLPSPATLRRWNKRSMNLPNPARYTPQPPSTPPTPSSTIGAAGSQTKTTFHQTPPRSSIKPHHSGKQTDSISQNSVSTRIALRFSSQQRPQSHPHASHLESKAASNMHSVYPAIP